MSLHRCLQVQDILSIIVTHVAESASTYPTVRTREALRTLAALARTCKAFYLVALSRLWEVQDTLDNLMECLPELSWSIDDEGSVVLRPDFPHDGWTNFDFHAQLVRELILPWPHVEATESVEVERTLTALAWFHPETSGGILPRVSVIYVTLDSAMGLVGLVALLGHEVRCLRFWARDFINPTKLSPDVDTIATPIPPSLQGLDIQAHARTLFRQSLARWTSSVRELYLEGANISVQDVVIIALLPHLTHLGLRCLSSWWAQPADVPSGGRFFPKLEGFVLECVDSVSTCTALLNKFRPESLKRICLGEKSAVPLRCPLDLHDFFTALSTPRLSESITLIDCSLSKARSFGDGEMVSFSEVEPLLSLRGLTHFSIFFEGDFHFEDQDFSAIVDSWPLLEYLFLYCSPDCDLPEELPTTQALVNLARHPRLEDVTLSFDPSVIAPTSRITNARIHFLSPAGAPLHLSDIPAMATFLKELLPTIYARGVDNLDWEDGWSELNDYMGSHRTDSDSGSEGGA